MKTDQTVLLTGATGFLGSAILRLLLQKNFFVVAVKREASNTSRIQNFIGHRNILIVNRGDEHEYIESRPVEYIIHTATCYGRSGETEEEIFEANYTFPKELFDAGRASHARVFINTDTFFKEDVQLDFGLKTYVASKKQFLRYMIQHGGESGMKHINLVIQQMYGPADNAKKFFPTMIKRLARNEQIDLTPGDQKRDFVYVDDVAEAYLSAIERVSDLDQYEQFEIGVGTMHSIKHVMETLKTKLKSASILNWGALPYRENEYMEAVADTTQNKKIDWKADTSLENGIQKTIAYLS